MSLFVKVEAKVVRVVVTKKVFEKREKGFDAIVLSQWITLSFADKWLLIIR